MIQKDPDTDEFAKQTTIELITNEQKETIKGMFEAEEIKDILREYKKNKVKWINKSRS